jgi:beta-glucosidase
LKFIEDLKFYNSDLEFVAEPGQFDVYIGASSDADKKVSFELNK